MKKILFKKLSGAGNDFVLIDREENSSIDLNPNIISKICSRRTGVGADGVLEIINHNKYDFELKYYNSDGYLGSLCGNGSRCAIKYAYVAGKFKNESTRFICDGEIYKGEIISEKEVKFYLQSPKNLRQDLQLEYEKQSFKGDFIDSGSPHFVVEIESEEMPLNKFDVLNFGKKLRHHPEFSPGGTNVNFVQINDENVNIRTFERGVEDETLACGTGCVASAFILFLNNRIKPPVNLIVKSEEKLVVDFEFDNKEFKNISLVGPAEIVFSGEYYII